MKIGAAVKGKIGKRGFVMIVALFIVVIVLMVALAVLANSSNAANDALSIQTKNQTFNAAEAGLNVALWQLDQNHGLAATSTPNTCSSTVNGYTCAWQVVSNQIALGGNSATDPDPHQTNSVTVAAGQAYIVGSASSILGGRTVYVEQIVAPGPPTYLPNGAIICGGNAQISHQQINDTSGNHSADIHCGTITAVGGGQVPQGNTYASGITNAITGQDGKAHIDQTPATFLTAGQLDAIQSTTLAASKTSPNFYTAGNVTNGNIGSAGTNCVAYIGGNITLSGNKSIINYCATTVVMGNFTMSGSGTYQALPMSVAHITYVFGTGGTILNGTPTTFGFVYGANADITINGSGNNTFNGGVLTPHNVIMGGGGTGAFNYNGLQTPPPVPNPDVVPEAQWEY